MRDKHADKALWFLKATTNRWQLCLGFACLITWPWLMSSCTLTHMETIDFGSAIRSSSNLNYLVMALTGLAAALWRRRSARAKTGDVGYTLAAIGYLFSTFSFLCLAGAIDVDAGTLGDALFPLWPFVCGVAQAALYLSWIRQSSKDGAQMAIAIILVSSIAGAGALIVANALPQSARIAIAFAVGIGAPVLLRQAERRASDAAQAPEAEKKRFATPWKLLASATVAGCSFGAIQSSSFGGAFGSAAWLDFGAVAFMLAAALLFSCAMFWRFNFNTLMYSVAFVAMASGSLLIYLIPYNQSIGYGLFCMGYRFFECILWAPVRLPHPTREA